MQPRVPHSHQFPSTVWPAIATVPKGTVSATLLLPEMDTKIGNINMQIAANSSLLTTASSFKRFVELDGPIGRIALYQRLPNLLTNLSINSMDPAVFTSLARSLFELAERAYTFRLWDVVDTIGQIMLTLPASKTTRATAKYFRALGLSRGGNGDIQNATHLLETAASYAAPHFRARAITALGSNRLASGDYESALFLYQEADAIMRLERAAEITVSYVTRKMRAVLKSLNGDHRGALLDLEQMFPIVKVLRAKQPFAYYDYLNSLAVELVVAGRFVEARRACEIAIASPYAPLSRARSAALKSAGMRTAGW